MMNRNYLSVALISCSLALSACGGSDKKSTTPNSLAPVITLSGNSTVELLKGETYSEPGVMAEDDIDGMLTVASEGSVNTALEGSYVLTYRATDSDGNTTTKTRTVTVLPSAILSIQSKNYFTGSIVEGAAINISSVESGASVLRSGVTDSNGLLSISVADDAEQVVVNGDADGFGEFSELALAVDQVVDIFLQPINAEVAFTPTEESNLDVAGLSVVTIAANSLIDENGNAAVSEVSAELTVIDPSSDPDLMSGNFETVNSATGAVENIESFGAVNITFQDASGNRYNLADGQTATVRIPLAANAYNPPQTLPLYYFDETSGYWVKEGTAALTMINGESYYEGTVNHFSTWSANNIYSSVQITGCIQDAESNSVSFAEIQTQGRSYSGQSVAFTDLDGEFSISAKPGSYVLISAKTPSGLTRTKSVYVGTEDLALTECIILESSAAVVTLSWGENPSDLDTQFFSTSTEAGDDDFLVYFGNQEVAINNSNIWLDVDDTSSYGPEITTISSFPFAGRYSYAIYHFSGLSDIAASPARVELDFEGEREIFSPPQGEATLCWAVFDFIVDDLGAITVETVGEWKDESYCYTNGGSDYMQESSDVLMPEAQFRSSSVVKKKAPGILEKMIKQKYYAD